MQFGLKQHTGQENDQKKKKTDLINLCIVSIY